MSESAIVPLVGGACRGCDAWPGSVAWAQCRVHRTTAGEEVRREPVGVWCRECAEDLAEAARPGEVDWAAVATDESALAGLPEVKRRRRGSPSAHEKHSVEVVTRRAVTWKEVVEPVDAAELRREYGSGPLLRLGVAVETVTDAAGAPREVVFCRPGQAVTAPGETVTAGGDRGGEAGGAGGPTVELTTTVETVHRVHRLRPETHVREAQGAEWAARVAAEARNLASRRAAGVRCSRRELLSRLRAAAPPPAAGALADRTAGGPRAAAARQRSDGGAGDAGASLGTWTVETVGLPGMSAGGGDPEAAGMPPRGAVPRGGRRLARRGSSVSGTGGGRPRKKSAAGGARSAQKKALPKFEDLSVEALIVNDVKNARETLWHQRQKMEGLSRTVSKQEHDALQERLELLTVAEALGRTPVALQADTAVAGYVQTLASSSGWSRAWPPAFARDVLAQQVKANVDKPEVVRDLIWPFRPDAEGEAPSFDPLSPRLRDCGASLAERVSWCVEWVSGEVLAALMPLDESGARGVESLWARMQPGQAVTAPPGQAVTAPPGEAPASLDPASQEKWSEMTAWLSSLAAFVQKGALTPEQLARLGEFKKHRASSAWKGAAKHLLRPWWDGREKACWRGAAAEALAQPRLERVTTGLALGWATPEADAAWAEAEEHGGEWGGLRAEVLAEAAEALGRSCAEAAGALADESSLAPAVAVVEKWAKRLAWFAAARWTGANPEDAKKLDGPLGAARARAKLAAVARLLGPFAGSGGAEVPAPEALPVDELRAALAGCRGLRARGADALAACRAIDAVGAMDSPPRELVALCSDLLSLLPKHAGAEPAVAGLEPSAAEWEATWGARLARTAAAWRVIDAVAALGGAGADGAGGETSGARAGGDRPAPPPPELRVAEARAALAEWKPHGGPEDPPTLPPSVGEEAATEAAVGEAQVAALAQAAMAREGEALERAVAELEAVAGGGAGAGESWKAKLSETSAWDDVASAAGAFLLAAPKASERTKPKHAAAGQAEARYRAAAEAAGAPGDATLLERTRRAYVLAITTQAEMYFAQTLTRTPKDRVAGELQSRMVSLSQKKVSPSLVQAVLWRKVQENVA